MAFTSDVHGRWAAAWHRWDGFGPFWLSLTRQAMRANRSDRFQAAIKLQDGLAVATLDALTPEGGWLNSAKVGVSGRTPDGGRMEPVECELVEPGRYTASVPAEAEGDYHIVFTVQLEGESAFTIERGFVADYPAELRIRPTNVALLQQIAQRSGGRFGPSAADVLRLGETVAPRIIALRPWLFLAAVLLFVFDLWLKRPSAPG
ncbi:MAG: hypothetical protein U1E05_26305 [Patescibacteria group bacterium]|nr:hypothetical protein [Patescibacteria group bacterium]